MSQSNNEMEKMQRDAEQRLRDMQRRSARYDLNTDIPPVPNFVQVGNNRRPMQSNRHRADTHEQKSPPRQESDGSAKNAIREPSKETDTPSLRKGFDLLKLFNFNNFKLDNDILVIVVLILLLSSEEADELLLMALVYIML